MHCCIEQSVIQSKFLSIAFLQALVGADNKSLQTMATEQLVELFALDGSKGASDPSQRTVSKSRKKETKIPYNIESPQNWDIEELWNQSQVILYSRP